jgi:putative chitinase
MGNGNELSGDGWKYRGRGYFQLTGFNNYRDFDKFVNDDILKNPDLVATKYPLLSAGWFWHKNNINNIADKGDSSDVCRSVRKIINGGTIGEAVAVAASEVVPGFV